ncbi:hypothetical protein ISS40_10920 [Candidatus Bathyarchaeota archaeon]|nr:hypothetical protein [Candidatus Bathyarchaeota archaeon]
MVEFTYQMVLSTLQTVALIVGIFYYIMTIRGNQRNQQLTLETREAQLMMQLWSSYQELRTQDQFWRNIEYKDFDDFWERYGFDPSFWEENGQILGWYENIGVLVKEGLLNIRLIALMYAGSTRQLWENLEPLMDGLREKFDYPRVWSETVYLCETLMRYMEEHPELKT